MFKNVSIGERFGRLTVIEKDDDRWENVGQIWYRCDCDCGRRILVNSAQLVDGEFLSCGCLAKKIQVGRTYNKLKVLAKEESKSKYTGRNYYDCECIHCGKRYSVRSDKLIQFNASCCSSRFQFSHGGVMYKNIRQLCFKYGIPYSATCKHIHNGMSVDQVLILYGKLTEPVVVEDDKFIE